MPLFFFKKLHFYTIIGTAYILELEQKHASQAS